MQPDPAKLANLWTTLINANLRAQWSRLREYWEPQFDASLTRMVDGCLSLANQALPADTAQSAPGQQATPVASLDNETRRVCADNLATALGILRQMAREQLQATIAAMTMDGLLVQTTPLSSPEEQDQAVNILAGGQALAESVTKSRDEFLARLRLALEQAEDAQARAEQIQAAGRWWRARLATIGHTVLYAVANRVRMTVSELL